MSEKKPFSLLLLIFLLSAFCSYHIYYYCLNEKNNYLVENYYVQNEALVSNPPVIVEKTNNNYEVYLGILKIPKLSMELGFYNLNSEKNDVNQNIQILKDSVMPNVLGGTIYFAAHSGDSYLGYFKNISKLEIGDDIIINYQNKDYNYIVNDIFELDKNGVIEVNKNVNENYVVLTTCSRNKEKQLIISGKLLKGV